MFHALWCSRSLRIAERKRQLEERVIFRFESDQKGSDSHCLLLVAVSLKKCASVVDRCVSNCVNDVLK